MLETEQWNYIAEIKSQIQKWKKKLNENKKIHTHILKMMRSSMHSQRLQMDKMFYDYDYSSCRKLFDPSDLLGSSCIRTVCAVKHRCVSQVFIFHWNGRRSRSPMMMMMPSISLAALCSTVFVEKFLWCHTQHDDKTSYSFVLCTLFSSACNTIYY